MDTPSPVLVMQTPPMRVHQGLTASAAKMAPLAPPMDWFETEEPDGPVPLTVTNEGRVYGHMATWDQCHTAYANACTLAPRSRSNYSWFHLGQIPTADGGRVDVGRITVGSSGHAPITYSMKAAVEHYDRTGTVAAFVNARDGKHGIWLSGAVRSDCPAEKVRDMMANPPSGDWRTQDGGLEMCAVLSVPIPGFPVPRREYAVVASGALEEISALVATGYIEPEPRTRAQMRRMSVLLDKAKTVASS